MSEKSFQLRSASEQVADHLRDRIKRGQLQGNMPGVHLIAEELGVHHTTVAESFRQLETEGCLKSEGAGKPRTITLPSTGDGVRLKVAILLYEAEDVGVHSINEMRHQISRAGHDVVVAPKSLTDLQFKVPRIQKVVQKVKADAWIVIAGSEPVLEWFSQQGIATYALFGAGRGLHLAHSATIKSPPLIEITQRLIQLGHQRMALLIGEQFRKPTVGQLAQGYLDELERHGLSPGSYHLPDWNSQRGGLQSCLNSLFKVTPPTALIFDDILLLPAILQFANQRKLTIPADLSLACLDSHTSLKWMDPMLCHLEPKSDVCIRHAVRWVTRLAKGQNDRRVQLTKAKLILGGSIAQASQRSR